MQERDWYTPKEVSGMLYMSPALVLLRLREGKFPGHKVGGRWVIPKKELERWMEEHEDLV